jgi:hypothetical protein
MSQQSKDALASVERIVFQSTEPVVVALTAGWGEGKTYFWKQDVIPKHLRKKPGYVSVFGAESLAVIRERVAMAASHLSDLAEGGKVPNWIKRLSGPAGVAVRDVGKFFGSKIGLSDSIAFELLQNFSLRPGWVICLDDVERLSPKVGLDNFLGYVTELRDKWKLKVVLIFNREPIDKDKGSPFHLYQEKVIDRSIPFALDLKDVVNLVFEAVRVPSVDVCDEVQKRAQVLGLRNIRILVRARSYFQEVAQILGVDAAPEYLRSALASLLLFSYMKFSNQKSEGLTFEMLAKHNEWEDRLRKTAIAGGGKDQPQADPGTKELLQQYQYEKTDDLDRLLMAFVQTDVLNANELRALYVQYQKDENKRRITKRLHDAFDLYYHGTMRDNPAELCDALEAALPPYLPNIPPLELDFSLVVLSKFGREAKALGILREFKRIRGEGLQQLDPHDLVLSGPYSYEPLKTYLVGLENGHDVDDRPIEAVIESAFYRSRFLDPADSARLAACSVDELEAYLLTHDQPKLTSKLAVLAKDNNSKVRALALGAAKRIAAISPLNRLRMEGMGLLLEQDGDPTSEA